MRNYKIIIMLIAIIAITTVASAEVVSTSTLSTQNSGAGMGNRLGENSQNDDRGMGDGVKADKKGRLVRGGKEVVLTVASNGDTVLRGVVTAIGSNNISVKTWGGVWTIDLSRLPSGFQQTDAAKIKVGDFIGVNGVMDQTTQIITAKFARIWDPSKLQLKAKEDNDNNRRGTSTEMMYLKRDEMKGTSTYERYERQGEGRRIPPPQGMMRNGEVERD